MMITMYFSYFVLMFVFLSVGRCQETVCLPAENDGDARVAGTAKDVAESTAKDTAFSVQCLRWGCTMDRWTGNLKVVSRGWTLDVVVYTSYLCYHDSNPRRKIEKQNPTKTAIINFLLFCFFGTIYIYMLQIIDIQRHIHRIPISLVLDLGRTVFSQDLFG